VVEVVQYHLAVWVDIQQLPVLQQWLVITDKAACLVQYGPWVAVAVVVEECQVQMADQAAEPDMPVDSMTVTFVNGAV
jgi:hypothetical protein